MLWFWGGSGLRILSLMEERGQKSSYVPFIGAMNQFMMSLYSYQIFSLKSYFLMPVEVEGFNTQETDSSLHITSLFTK